MTYIDTTDDWDDYDNGYGDIEPDVRDYAGPSDYCIHGSYVGNPYGADYICGACESGISYEDYQAFVNAREERNAKKFDLREGGTWLLRIAKRAVKNGDLNSDDDEYAELTRAGTSLYIQYTNF